MYFKYKKYFLALFIVSLSTSVIAQTRITQMPLSEIAIYPEVSIPASAISLNDARISAELRASVNTIPVLVGDTVKKGEILVELDDKDFKLNLLRAEVALKGIESRLTLANYQLDQAKSLIKEKAITDELLRQRQSDVTTLQAESEAQSVAVNIAKQELAKCIIRAPYNAVVVERIAQVGELANPGTALIRIVDASRIEVSARIQPQDVASLQKAGKVEFQTLEKSYALNLRTIIPIIDPVQRNREARFVFSKELALPGTSGTLVWKQTIPYVPSNIIVRRNGTMGIFINNNGTAKFIEIPDATEGRPAAVKLDATDKVIIDGRFSIQHGDALTTE